MSEKFTNDGFGWQCVKCAPEAEESSTTIKPRYLKEGDGEMLRSPFRLAARPRWTDESRSTLICDICGATDKIR